MGLFWKSKYDYLKEGQQKQALGQYEEAIAQYDNAIKKDSKYAAAFASKGDVLRILGKYEESVKCYEQAINIETKNSENFYEKGRVLYAIGRYEDAIKSYEQAIKYNPKNKGVFNDQGVAFESIGDYESAKDSYEAAIRISANDKVATENLKRLLQKEDEIGRLKKTPELTLEHKHQLGIVTHLEYAELSDRVYYENHDEQVKKLPPLENWQVFLQAKEIGLDKFDYYSTAYINKTSKNIVISFRGNTTDKDGLRADILLLFKEIHVQFALAEQFAKKVREKANNFKLDEYRISFTGHSLGGSLAEVMSVRQKSSAVTFDTPGSLPLIEKIKGHKIDPVNIDVITYVSAPNALNTVKPHVGKLVSIVLPEIEEQTKTSWQPGWWMYLFLNKNLQKVIEYFQYEIEQHVTHTSQQHEMRRILQVFRNEQVPQLGRLVLKWPENFLQYLTYSEIQSELRKINSLNDEILVEALAHGIEEFANYQYAPYDPYILSLYQYSEEMRHSIMQLLKKEGPARLAELGNLLRNTTLSEREKGIVLKLDFDPNKQFISFKTIGLTADEFEQYIKRRMAEIGTAVPFSRITTEITSEIYA